MAWDGTDRRTPVSIETIDREMGQVTALIESMGKRMEEDRKEWKEGFLSMRRDIEALTRIISDYKTSHDLQSQKDYTYLDNKIDELKLAQKILEVRLKTLEEAKTKGILPKILDTGVRGLTTGAMVVIAWLIMEYFKAVK